MATLQPIDTGERRAAERRSALDVHLCLVDLGDNRSGMLLDVSETGIGVQAVEGPGAGFTTSFRFQLPDTAVLVEGTGEIAWADRAGRMGIRYSKIAPELMPEIKRWIASEANPLFGNAPATEEMADLDARDRVAQLEARIIVSGWAQVQAINFLVDQVAAMTQASGVAIAVEDGSGIVCKASSGIAPQVGVRIDPRSGLSWECVRTREVVQCADTETDPRVDRLVCRQLNMRSAMLVPVKKDGRVAGLVEVFSSRPHAFSNQTVILLRRVAEAVASLDETAPDRGEESVLQMPAPEARAFVAPAVEKLETVKAAEPEKKFAAPQPAPVITRQTAPLPAPIPAPAMVRPVETPAVQPAAPPRPAMVVASAPPAVTPPLIAAPAAPKPATIAPVVPPPSAPKPVVARAAEPPAAVTPIAHVPTPPPMPTVKPVEKPVSAQTKIGVALPPMPPAPPIPRKEVEPERPQARASAEKVEVAPAQTPVKETTVVAAAAAPIERPAKPIVAEKATSIPSDHMGTAAPLPAVAFSGAAAVAAKMARANEIAAAGRDADTWDEPAPEAAPDVIFLPETSSAFGRQRKVIAGATAAVVVVAMLGYGGWRWSQQASTNAPSAQPAAASTPAPVLTSAAATTSEVSNAVTPPTATASPAATKPQPARTALATQSAPAQNQPPVSTEAQATASSQPVEVARESVPEPTPVAPPIAIAPPNTAGMASLFSGPVAEPRLSRQSVSQGVTGGKQIRRVQPVYPPSARAMRLTGTVILLAHVDIKGNVTRVEVVSGHPMLNASAVDAVRRWKYEPFQLNGERIENDINVQVKFDNPR